VGGLGAGASRHPRVVDACPPPHVNWEQDPDLELAYNLVLGRIQILAESGLTPMMVLHDYMSMCIAPLQECIRSTWLYIRVNDVM
jgi:hypothetical protein